MQKVDWMCPSAERALVYPQTIWIVVRFADRRPASVWPYIPIVYCCGAVIIVAPTLLTRIFVYIRTYHNALYWILNFKYWPGKPSPWRLRLPKFEFDSLQSAGIKHEADDTLLQFQTTVTGETPIKIDIPVPCITSSSPPKKEKASVGYMHDDSVIEDKGGFRLPTIYAIALSKEPKHDRPQITVPKVY